MKGIRLFTEIANCLKTVNFDGSNPNRGSKREFSEVEKMLKNEREEFEVRFLLLLDFDISCKSTFTPNLILLKFAIPLNLDLFLSVQYDIS